MKRKKEKKNLSSWLQALEDPKDRFFGLTNDFLAAITLLSVLAVVLESLPNLSRYEIQFNVIEYSVTLLFALEYLARVHLAKKKFSYIFSFFGIIDLMAVLPSWLGLGNFTFLKTARTLRIIRLLRMVRLVKLSKLKKKDGMSSLYGLNLQIYALSLISALLFLGALFYLFENSQAHGSSIPQGMYWAFKAIIGGITYPQPETLGGTITLVLARFCSMVLLGLMLSLVGTILRKLLTGSEKDS